MRYLESLKVKQRHGGRREAGIATENSYPDPQAGGRENTLGMP